MQIMGNWSDESVNEQIGLLIKVAEDPSWRDNGIQASCYQRSATGICVSTVVLLRNVAYFYDGSDWPEVSPTSLLGMALRLGPSNLSIPSGIDQVPEFNGFHDAAFSSGNSIMVVGNTESVLCHRPGFFKHPGDGSCISPRPAVELTLRNDGSLLRREMKARVGSHSIDRMSQTDSEDPVVSKLASVLLASGDSFEDCLLGYRVLTCKKSDRYVHYATTDRGYVGRDLVCARGAIERWVASGEMAFEFSSASDPASKDTVDAYNFHVVANFGPDDGARDPILLITYPPVDCEEIK